MELRLKVCEDRPVLIWIGPASAALGSRAQVGVKLLTASGGRGGLSGRIRNRW